MADSTDKKTTTKNHPSDVHRDRESAVIERAVKREKDLFRVTPGQRSVLRKVSRRG